jgi:hypothetical protein
MKTTKATPQDKANYIIKLMKSVGKDLKYAIDTAVWYTMTDREREEVEKIIAENWSK